MGSRQRAADERPLLVAVAFEPRGRRTTRVEHAIENRQRLGGLAGCPTREAGFGAVQVDELAFCRVIGQADSPGPGPDTLSHLPDPLVLLDTLELRELMALQRAELARLKPLEHVGAEEEFDPIDDFGGTSAHRHIIDETAAVVVD